MERNSIFAVLFLLFGFLLNAQEQEAGYFVDFSNYQPRIFQRFVWEKEEYALRYELVIQVWNNGLYYDFLTETTDDHFLEVTLSPGNYRYSVIPFDFLGQRGDSSGWSEFEVLIGFIPILDRFAPDFFHMDKYVDRVLDISGINLNENSLIFLRNGNTILHPREIIFVNEQLTRLFFNDDELIQGVYDIVVVNPGGFENRLNNFIIDYSKPLDIFFRIGYTPAIPIYGELKDIFGSDVFLLGGAFGIESVSSKRSAFNGGLEIGASVYLINSAVSFKKDYDELITDLRRAADGALLASFDFNIAFQRRFNGRKNVITTRIGIGLSSLSGFGSYDLNETTAHFNFCLSGLFQLLDIFYLEAGLDFTHYFSRSHFGLIKPRLGIVWQY